MPQPLRNLIRGQTDVEFYFELPLHNPKLCALAMNVIAMWSYAERDLGNAVIAFMPGKSGPVATIFTSNHADSPKAAIRNVLAATLLEEAEFAIFDGIMKRYETCYKLRNPIAHWSLGYCKQIPDGMLAQDPVDHMRVNSEVEALRDDMLKETSDPARQHLEHNDRLSDETAAKMKPVVMKHTETMMVYREADLLSITKAIDGLRECIHIFTVAIRMRILKIDPEGYNHLLRQLSQKLGLPEPKAG